MATGITPYADLDDVLRVLVEGVRTNLGDRMVGVYLQGSLAVGGFDEHSEVDFVIAVDAALGERDVLALQDLHGRVYDLDCGWAQHLEGSYFPVDVLRSCGRRGEALWYLDNGARSLVQSTHCNTAVVRQTLREHGCVLSGPEPRALIDPIPLPLLREEMFTIFHDWSREVLAEPEHWANRFYQGFIALSYCRVWCDLTTGVLGSKRRGAEWAKERLDPSWADLIDRAWSTRPDPATSARTPADPDDYERTLALTGDSWRSPGGE